MILLDTDHLTVLKYIDSERCRTLRNRLADSDEEWVGTTIVNVEEQMRGWLASISRETITSPRDAFSVLMAGAEAVTSTDWLMSPTCIAMMSRAV